MVIQNINVNHDTREDMKPEESFNDDNITQENEEETRKKKVGILDSIEIYLEKNQGNMEGMRELESGNKREVSAGNKPPVSAGTAQGDSQNLDKKKVVVQGMVDVALLTANASQLKNLLAYGTKSHTYQIALVCIIASLFLQIAVGLTMILFRQKFGVLPRKLSLVWDNLLDLFIMGGVFLITILNVFIATFTSLGEK